MTFADGVERSVTGQPRAKPHIEKRAGGGGTKKVLDAQDKMSRAAMGKKKPGA